MPVKKVEDRRTIDFEVSGEPPVEQAFTPTPVSVDATGLRVVIVNGHLEFIWVYGLKYNANGMVGRAKHSFPIGEEKYAPHWVIDIVEELGVDWPVESGDDDNA